MRRVTIDNLLAAGIVASLITIGALFGRDYFRYSHRIPPHGIGKDRVRLTQLEQAIQIYRMKNNGRLPASLQELRLTNSVDFCGTKRNLDYSELTDSWGRPVKYSVSGNRFKLWSLGPDGVDGTEDDISN